MAPSDRREDVRLVAALVLLTLLTGLVDAASVLGLGHVFTANMTGNVVFLGFSLVGAGRVATSDCVVALAAFVAGAIVAGRLARPGARFALALALEAVSIAAAALIAATAGVPAPSLVAEIALLAFAMGVQNASVRKLGVVDMTTTVLTLTLTGLAADSPLAGGTSPRVRRRLTSVAVMLVGAVTGALLLRRGVSWTIGAAALVATSACVVASSSARRPPHES
ncbi:MAG TPA: YoaK family protein [Polyangia bacterium]|nr:YoaK family protein [Polyangia bacterium]